MKPTGSVVGPSTRLRPLMMLAAGGLLLWVGSTVFRGDDPDQTPRTSQAVSLASDFRSMEAWELLRSFVHARLREHDAKLTIERHRLGDAVKGHFDRCKDGAESFADAATTFGNRFVAFFSADRYRSTLRELLAERVIRSDSTAEAISTACNAYLLAVSQEEAALLRDVRAQVEALPDLATESELDRAALQRLVERFLDVTAVDVQRQARLDAVLDLLPDKVKAVAKDLCGPGMPSLAKHLVAKSAEETVMHQLGELISGFGADADEVQSRALRLCDEMKVVLIEGSEEARADFEALMATAEDPEVSDQQRAEARALAQGMRNRGYLGLDAMLGFVQERNLFLKAKVLQHLGLLNP